MKKLASTLAIGMALASASAMASDGTITINGEISAVTCTINGGNKNFTVTLPTVSANSFSGVSSTTGLTQFTIQLTNCQNYTSKSARTYFEPNATGVGGAGNIINTSGTESGVAVQLLNKNKNPINPNLDITSQDPDNTSVSIGTGSGTLNYYVQYIQVTPTITPGTFRGNIAYDIHYQ